MFTVSVKTSNQVGLHAQEAKGIVRIAESYESQILLQYLYKKANAKSLFSIIAAGIIGGADIKIIADGPDEERAATALAEFIKNECSKEFINKLQKQELD